MKLTVFQADKGDCLLLEGADGKTMLVDGGMRGSFKQHVAPNLGVLAKDGIDMVYVSHIDQDHIAGILQMMDDEVAWRVYEYQVQSGNLDFSKPENPRPPEIRAVWHNAFKDQVQDNSGEIEDQLIANTRIVNLDSYVVGEKLAQKAEACSNLVTSIRQGLLLSSRIGANQLNIPVNAEFGGKLISVEGPPQQFPFGGMDLFIIGPFREELEKLREKWNQWLEKNQEAVRDIRTGTAGEVENLTPEELTMAEAFLDEGQMVFSSIYALANELGRRELVTTPNLASIMILVEETGRTLLLTGDGHAADILKGLRRHGKLDSEDRIHVDVLKVQHHGSEHNIDPDFCKAVTADHYIFCGNGAHENPNLDVLQTIIGSRLGSGGQNPHAGKRFKFWFNSSSKMADSDAHRVHMEAVEKLVRTTAKKSRGQMRRRFLTRGSKLTITL